MPSLDYADCQITESLVDHPLYRQRPTWRQFLMEWSLTAFTSVWIAFTIFFAWNSTLVNPFAQSLLPTHTITILNILSHVTVFLLQLLASSVFEAVRWAYASMDYGISSFGFIVMSRATGPLGVFYLLLFGSGTEKGESFWTGHRLWGWQRLVPFLTPITVGSGSLLFIAPLELPYLPMPTSRLLGVSPNH